jgi:hypothetical protein
MTEKYNSIILEKNIPYKWNLYLGRSGQQNLFRVPVYNAFKFCDPNKVDLKVWKEKKDYPGYYVPNKRTKAGREKQKILDSLKVSSIITLKRILGMNFSERFVFPWVEIVNDNTIILFIDEEFEPKGEEFIEITKREFEELQNKI